MTYHRISREITSGILKMAVMLSMSDNLAPIPKPKNRKINRIYRKLQIYSKTLDNKIKNNRITKIK